MPVFSVLACSYAFRYHEREIAYLRGQVITRSKDQPDLRTVIESGRKIVISSRLSIAKWWDGDKFFVVMLLAVPCTYSKPNSTLIVYSDMGHAINDSDV